MNPASRQNFARGFYFVASLVALALLTQMAIGGVQLYRMFYSGVAAQEPAFPPGYLPTNPDTAGLRVSDLSDVALHVDPAQTILFLLGPLLLVAAGRFFDQSRGREWLGRTAAGLVLLLYLSDAAVLVFLLRFTWS